MAKSIQLPFDATATIKVFGLDQVGLPRPLPAGAVVTSDDPSVTATMSADLTSVAVSATKQSGSGNLSLALAAGGPVVDTTAVAIIAPAVTGGEFDTSSVTFAANPNAPTA